jgi:hypothetical protein
MADKYLPAFPQQVQVAADGTTWFDGMTLRDFFAAKAMQGLIANNNIGAQQLAYAAYVVADAMMEARGS